ncbi:2Fe-2S iron-sulfur cluster-binding protein [Pontibacter sp. JAM-7]|uniref:2Fe-2S iron-sulfur cluster-binding protein n=1 Tax=Pontibacter sp. JAM-7 TaxID=3366581 RepID=UPI003AF91C51
MATVHFEDTEVNVAPGSNLLEALLTAGHDIPNSCRAGACQSCMMQLIEGELPAAAQQGLKATHKAQGYFLACCCEPEAGLRVQRNPASQTVSAVVVDKELLPGRVLRLRMSADIHYRPGQFVNLVRDDGLSRAYSLASVPELERELEVQIRVHEDGQFSQWAQQKLAIGDTLKVQGAFGDCFYLAEQKQQPLLLAGTGTGLSPLYGIVRDALRVGHDGPIHLFAGSRVADDLYLDKELRALDAVYQNFSYTPVVLEGAVPEGGGENGDLNQVLKSRFPDTKGYRAYFCGSPQRVQALRKQTFLAGASMQDIHCDLFTPSSQAVVA